MALSKEKSYFQVGLPDESMINVLKFVKNPLNLLISCKSWQRIGEDSQARAEWLIFQFGVAHCLFHAIRLGPTFLSIEVAKAIIAKGGVLSRYFAQRLLIHYGKHDPKLIKQKIAHNVGQLDLDRLRRLQQESTPWASDLQISVYMFLLTEASSLFGDNLYLKGNDMELFHFLSGGPNTITYAPSVLEKNYEEIEDLILCNKFIPFPPRKTEIMQGNNMSEEYPPKDGYENNRQLNVIARSILIHKDLVLLWKKIGYFGICGDVNDLVMQGAFLLLFPPTPPPDWVKPDANAVEVRLTELIHLGFQLDYSIIIDIFHLFETRLDDIGKILIDSFAKIWQVTQIIFLRNCLVEILEPIKVKRISNMTKVTDFIYKHLPDSPEVEFNRAFEARSRLGA